MAIAIKALGGIGKAIIGTGGRIAKSGARFLGDDAVEAVGHKVGELQKGINEVVENAVKQDDLYKSAVKEARGAVSDTAKDAIKNPAKNYKQRTEFGSADGTRYRMREIDGATVYESKMKDDNWAQIQDQGRTKASQIYGKARGEYIAYNDSLAAKAEELSKTGAGDSAGIDLLQFASDHPVGTALAGLGVGVVGTNLLDSNN